MRGVREHIHGLYGYYAISCIEILQVARLSGWITADIDDTLGGCPENGLHYIRVHACTRGVGDDDIRASMLLDESVVKDILHVACIEAGVRDAVELGVDLRILDGFWHIFDADDFPRLPSHEIGDGAGTGIKVVDHFVACSVFVW